MNPSLVNVCELIAWDLDEYEFRSSSSVSDRDAFQRKIIRAHARLARRHPYKSSSAVLEADTQEAHIHLDRIAVRPDLHEYYRGFDWNFAIVDLHRLLAFQRRLIISPTQQPTEPHRQQDWAQLFELAFGRRRSTEHHITQSSFLPDRTCLRLESNNPDLQVRRTIEPGINGSLPLALHGGSPNFEVAEFRGRWFLRDGYHRAYHLLRQGIHHMPAIVVRARTIEELGATEPWFFAEHQLFSERPPHLADFLEDELTSSYQRIALRKVIQIHIEHTLEPCSDRNSGEREQS